MNKERLLDVLKLESVAHLLSWEERIMIHLMIGGRASQTTERIEKMRQWIICHQFEVPLMRYGQDRLLYFQDRTDDWVPIEELNEYINQFKIL